MTPDEPLRDEGVGCTCEECGKRIEFFSGIVTIHSEPPKYWHNECFVDGELELNQDMRDASSDW